MIEWTCFFNNKSPPYIYHFYNYIQPHSIKCIIYLNHNETASFSLEIIKNNLVQGMWASAHLQYKMCYLHYKNHAVLLEFLLSTKTRTIKEILPTRAPVLLPAQKNLFCVFMAPTRLSMIAISTIDYYHIVVVVVAFLVEHYDFFG